MAIIYFFKDFLILYFTTMTIVIGIIQKNYPLLFLKYVAISLVLNTLVEYLPLYHLNYF